MSEFIGSRISLISRSDIRYVGTLHQIDSDNSTVGLESVTNHGTEGRCEDPANEVDGTDEIYDYIVFRGSDVKDLRMEPPETAPKPAIQPSFPNDPAIINAQRPPGYPPPQFAYQQNGRPGPQGPQGQPGPPGPPGQPGQFNQNFPQGFYPHPQMGPGGRFYGQPYMGGFPGGPGAPGAPGFPPGPFGPYGMPPLPFPGPGGPNQTQPLPVDVRSRAGTQNSGQSGPNGPSQANKVELPIPTMDNDKAPEPKTAIPVQQPPPPPLESKPDVATALTQPMSGQPQPAGPRNVGGRGRGGPRGGRGGFGNLQQAQPQAGTTVTTTTTTFTPAVPVGVVNTSPSTDSPGLADLERRVNAMKLNHTNGSSQQNRVNNNGPGQHRGRGRGRGVFQGQQPRKVEVPTTDYDFESANARFAKVADSEDVAAPIDEVAESSTEVGKASFTNEAKPAIISPPDGYYNKGKSFFDNISCENKERAEVTENRPGAQRRGEEVRKNIETFGQGSVDSGYNRRGNWRGGRNRGHGGGRFRGRGRGGHTQQVQPNS